MKNLPARARALNLLHERKASLERALLQLDPSASATKVHALKYQLGQVVKRLARLERFLS